MKKGRNFTPFSLFLAERGGFEPPVRFHVRTLSKRVP